MFLVLCFNIVFLWPGPARACGVLVLCFSIVFRYWVEGLGFSRPGPAR